MVVTYMDSGWIRIPWQSASVSHLHAMADIRKAQADALYDKARDLRALADALGEPDDGTLISEAVDRLAVVIGGAA